MDRTLHKNLVLIIRSLLYLSIFIMITGTVIHMIWPKAGRSLAVSGIYIILSCPLAGLFYGAYYGFTRGNKKLFRTFLFVASFILSSIVIILMIQ